MAVPWHATCCETSRRTLRNDDKHPALGPGHRSLLSKPAPAGLNTTCHHRRTGKDPRWTLEAGWLQQRLERVLHLRDGHVEPVWMTADFLQRLIATITEEIFEKVLQYLHHPHHRLVVDHHYLRVLRSNLPQWYATNRRDLLREAEQIFRIRMQQIQVGDQLVPAELVIILQDVYHALRVPETFVLQLRVGFPQLRQIRLGHVEALRKERVEEGNADTYLTTFDTNCTICSCVTVTEPPLFFFGSESTAFRTYSSSWCGLCCLMSTNTSATSCSMYEWRQNTDAYSRFMMSASPWDSSIDCTIGCRSLARSCRSSEQKKRITETLASRWSSVQASRPHWMIGVTSMDCRNCMGARWMNRDASRKKSSTMSGWFRSPSSTCSTPNVGSMNACSMLSSPLVQSVSTANSSTRMLPRYSRQLWLCPE
uniref:Uncharacterized protein n=1 Tax=Anopheles atroparvus TaxID=41427 RepID=A0A182IW68_ANOAO